jgi:hypothetical protein
MTTTAQFGKTRDEGVFATALAVRLALVPIACIIGASLWLSEARELGLGILLGALLNLWNGARATDQARQDHESFLRTSIAFAALRLVAGLIAILFHPEPMAIAAAIYAIPLVATFWSNSYRLLTRSFSVRLTWNWRMTRYSTYVYVAGMSFVALPYAPQLILSSGGNEVTISTYGIILTFAGNQPNILLSTQRLAANDAER